MLKKLNRANTGYTKLRPVKVLQFGDGNFLRGFADWVIDILNEKTDFNGDVLLVRPLRKNRISVKDEQDGLYHVILKGLQHGEEISITRLITCVAGAINPYTAYDQFLRAAENPDLQFIISNTTEAGIAFNPNDHDPNALPESFPAKVAILLYHRFKFFKGNPGKGLVLMPCELIEKNGDALKSIILQYCNLWKLPDAFVLWLSACNSFCNSLVDRIVPGFPKETIQEIQQATGYEDKVAVSAEPFYMWVIEAPKYVQLLFPAEKAGLSVKYVDDLTPYRAQKVSILNGAHTALVPVAYLRGLRTVRESVDDAYVGEFIRKAIFKEIIPTLDLPADELKKFADATLERFQNPFIRHELKSIALNSVSKFKVRVLPTILEYKKRTGKLPKRLLYSFAALILFYKGEWKGETLPVNDTPEVITFFKEAWSADDPEMVLHQVLENTSLWGSDLTEIDGLSEIVKKSLLQLETTGMFATP
ncbi:MAG: tagaturonate reductase [Cyclobacteriaceae bacterium]|nr:tagaturonate reductase [Cyclobacteriaceae bacterium]